MLICLFALLIFETIFFFGLGALIPSLLAFFCAAVCFLFWHYYSIFQNTCQGVLQNKFMNFLCKIINKKFTISKVISGFLMFTICLQFSS